MKIKSKILMAVLAVFFMAAGNAMAIPTVDYTVNGNVLNFTLNNDLTNFGVYRVGFDTPAVSDKNSFVLPTGVIYLGSNGYDVFNVVPYLYGVNSITDIMITVSNVPNAVNSEILVEGQSAYTGTDAIYLGHSTNSGLYLYEFVGQATSVPEPATLILLGLGLLGVIGVRKKMHK